MRTALLLTSLLIAALPGDDPVIARAGDLEFHRSEFGDWLVSRYGSDYLEEFVCDQLVIAEATRRGLPPTDEQIEAAWTEEYDTIIRNGYDGKPEQFEHDLQVKGMDLATYKEHRVHGIRAEVAEANLARADRKITDDFLMDRFRQEYGPDAEVVKLGVLFFSTFQRVAAGADGSMPDFPALRAASRARADAARAALQAGTPLADLLPDADRPTGEAVHDGVLEHFRERQLGTEVDRAVESLDNPGDISPVIDVYDGCFVIQLIERRKVAFESVREDLLRAAQEAPVTSQEYGDVRAAVVAARHPEYLHK